MMRLVLAHGEAPGLAAYLDRLLELDARARVRLQAGAGVLAVWSQPPFDVVALRPVALSDREDIDVTVSARRLRDQLADARTALAAEGETRLELPPPTSGPSWVGLLPPRSGWQERDRASVAAVRDKVDSAVELFRTRTEGVTDRSALEAAAADVWQRTVLAEVPVRAAHAAQSLNLLGPGEGEVVAWVSDPWLRLTCPGGSIALHRAESVNLFVIAQSLTAASRQGPATS